MSGSEPVTPFIPPFEMPGQGPSSSASPVRPPVVPPWSPQSPQGQTLYPPPSQGHNPYYSPYSTPFVPPAMIPTPGSYYMPNVQLPEGTSAPPGPPPGPPPGAPVHSQQMPPSGFSADWTGFPLGGPPGFSPAGPPPLATPYGPPQGSPWGGPPPVQPGYTTFSAFQTPLPPTYPPQPYAGQWQQFQTPGGPYGTPGTPYGMYQTPAWAPAGMPPMFGAPPAGPAARPRPPERLVRSERLDRLSPFLAGPHYGPVLTPMLLKAVNASLQVNPLLLPVGESDRVHLKWNMLFSTAHCQRSTDPSHRSWSNGRSEPATFPRVSSLRLVSRTVPWIIDISAANPAVGVTCGDVVEQLSEYLQRRLRKEDYETAREDRRRLIRQAYHHNRSRSEGVPGGQLGDGLKRLDWLGTQTMWGGLERNDSFIMERYGVSLPCTLELVCYDRPMMSEQQIEEERRARRRSTASRRPSRPQSRAQSRPPSRSDGSNSS